MAIISFLNVSSLLIFHESIYDLRFIVQLKKNIHKTLKHMTILLKITMNHSLILLHI